MQLLAPKFPPGWNEDAMRRVAEFLSEADPIDIDEFDGRVMAAAGRTIVFNLPSRSGKFWRVLSGGCRQEDACRGLWQGMKIWAAAKGLDVSLEALPHEALARVKFAAKKSD